MRKRGKKKQAALSHIKYIKEKIVHLNAEKEHKTA